jgi:DNA-binding MarR family transcriptional regulator/GNAT superfamily N-acetyltransferase
MSSSTRTDAQIHALRSFNRFYTRRAGVLDPFLSSTLSLTDVRVLYELAHTDTTVASDIARAMGIDNGYLSRILKRFDATGWIERMPNPRDQRQSLVSLTPKGREAYAPLNEKSHSEASGLLESLSAEERERLMAAMNTIEALLTPSSSTPPTPPNEVAPTPKTASGPTPTATAIPAPEKNLVLRNIRAGDLGWVLHAHGEIYTTEWGLNAVFESVVADVVAGLSKMDPSCERGWIAEVDGERVGSVFVAKAPTEGVARIRLLLLTSGARGLGLGGRLVDECIAFARESGYAKLELWTQNILTAARAIYLKRGFRVVKETPSDEFGRPVLLVSYEKDLQDQQNVESKP